MVQVASVKALDHHVTRVSEVLKHADSLLINAMGVVVLSESTVIHVRQLARDLAIVEKVVYVNLIDVPSLEHAISLLAAGDRLLTLTSLIKEGIQIALLSLETQAHAEVMIIILLGTFNTIGVQSSFHPCMVEDLRD